MELIPDDILTQFNTVLEQKAVPFSVRDVYRERINSGVKSSSVTILLDALNVSTCIIVR